MRLLANAACFVVLMAAIGCTSSSASNTGATGRSGNHRGRTLVILAIDDSISTEAIRSQLLSNAHELAVNLDPDSSDIVLFRFGHTVEEVWSGPPPDDEDAFALTLAKFVKPSDQIRGTDYPRALQAIADRAKSSREDAVEIVIAGDALNDYTGDDKREHDYRLAAKELAANRKVSYVRYWGAAVGSREELHRVWRGCDEKLQVASLDQPIQGS